MSDMLPVSRPKTEAQNYYDRLSKIYDWLTSSERALVEKGVKVLAPVAEENILEIGCGTGTGLAAVAEILGESGKIVGLDLAFKMLTEAKRKHFSSQPNTLLAQGDAAKLPFANSTFDGVYCAFTLELFSAAEMKVVLDEIRRILIAKGRLVVVSLSRTPHNLAVRLYEFGHRVFPVALDCRPIPLEEILKQSGFVFEHSEKFMNWGLPVDIVLAR
jgi:ubiquinone/menaquinone biosynthesis C-methylase UbiE